MIRRFALASALVVAMSANALALDYGVNIHSGGGSTSANDQIASIMAQRNIKNARLDMFGASGGSAIREQVQKIRANGGKAQVTLQISYQWDHSCNPNLSYVEQDSYTQTYNAVNSTKDIIHDYELLNEVTLRPEILREVPWNQEGTTEATYEGKPCVATLTAVLRGMSRAIRDLRASSGLPLRTIMGAVGRDFELLGFLQSKGVLFDVVGYHIYPHNVHTSLLSDPWFGSGGAIGQLAKYANGRPVHINEFNCGEIYTSGYENQAGSSVTETCLKSLVKHLKDLRSQTVVNLEEIHVYELLDAPSKPVPENRFGMMYDLSRPKVHLYLATAFAGGTLSAAERYEITRRGLLTDAEIDAMRVSQAPATESAHGSSITSSGTLVDSTGAKWTLSGGVIYRNGVATISSSVTLLLYWNKVIYQQNSYGGWWAWINGGWQATTDPRVSEPAVAPAPGADTQAPTIGINNPGDGAAFARRSTVSASATASDNVGVKEVRFSLDKVVRCVSTSAPYTCELKLPNSRNWTGTIEAQAVDAAGNVGRSSVRVSTY